MNITTLNITMNNTINRCADICNKWNFELKGIFLLWIAFIIIAITSIILFLMFHLHNKGHVNKNGELKKVTDEQLIKYLESLPWLMFWIADILGLLIILHYFF